MNDIHESIIDTIQAQYTDLLILNKHELVSERQLETCIDRILDLELDIPTPRILSQKGRVDKDLVFGLDAKLAQLDPGSIDSKKPHEHTGEHEHAHGDHQSEVEVLSVTLTASDATKAASVDLEKLEELLKEASKDEVYRMKAILCTTSTPMSSNGERAATTSSEGPSRYILNWAFGRWTFTAAPQAKAETSVGLPTPADSGKSTPVQNAEPVLRMTIITARDEAAKWKRNIERDGSVALVGDVSTGSLTIEKVG